MPRRINPRLIKLNHCYSVEEAGGRLGVHRNTVRDWLSNRGLEAIDGGRPILIQGEVLRAFLEARRAAAKRPCPPGTLYCFRCRAPRAPALDMADFTRRAGGGSGDLSAICGVCETVMHRAARESAIAELLPGIAVRIVEAPRHIAECPNPPLNCDLKTDAET